MNQGIDFSQLPLRDIHLPSAVAWWPPAIGWWILAAVFTTAAVLWGVRYYRLHRQRVALRLLAKLKQDLEVGTEPTECLQLVSSVLRRYAMSTAANPALVAGLIGRNWLRYLDSCWDKDVFTMGSGRSLTVAPYAPVNAVAPSEAIDLTALVIEWVKCQRPGK